EALLEERGDVRHDVSVGGLPLPVHQADPRSGCRDQLGHAGVSPQGRDVVDELRTELERATRDLGFRGVDRDGHSVEPLDHGHDAAQLLVGLLEMAAGAVRHLYAVRNRARSDARVRDAIFAHALRLDASYHDRVGPGELMSRASSDSEQVARMMDSIGHTIGYVLTVFAVAVVLLVIDWRLALIVLIPLP